MKIRVARGFEFDKILTGMRSVRIEPRFRFGGWILKFVQFEICFIMYSMKSCTVNFHTQRSERYFFFSPVRKIFRLMRIVNNVFPRETQHGRPTEA